MKTIVLTQGQVALVDDEDYEFLSQHNWYAHRQKNGRFYAMRNFLRPDNKRRIVAMHRIIMKAEKGDQIDHRRGEETLDNQKSNLRKTTAEGNGQAYQRKTPGCSSCYRGVYWHQVNQVWVAQIKVPRANSVEYLGSFNSELSAAKARDSHARDLAWPESGMNFPAIAPVSVCSRAACPLPDWHHW